MNEELVLDNLEKTLKYDFDTEGSGHDYFHLKRVVDLCIFISNEEKQNIDEFILLLTAWLHDVGDYKLNNGIDKTDEKIKLYLNDYNIDDKIINQIIKNINEISFSKGLIPTSMEAKIVQDADRLDAIGAIGIARAFTFGGSKKRIIYDPNITPNIRQSKEEYKNNSNPTINHFYEKLLLLKEKMNTTTAKEIAKKRHLFMEEFLKQFYNEINNFY